MKKILLLGDSIRLGYDSLVKMAFEEKAQVFYPQENCRFAAYILMNLHIWKEQLGCGDDVDCVHWNAGLWDTLVLYQDGTLTPVDVYGAYIDRICKRLRLLFPKAKTIFATSTPVNEALFPEPDKKMRYNRDIEMFNEVAIEKVKRNGGEINDLYSFLKNAPIAYHSDMTHFYTKAATEAITGKVLKSIEKCLDMKASPIQIFS